MKLRIVEKNLFDKEVEKRGVKEIERERKRPDYKLEMLSLPNRLRFFSKLTYNSGLPASTFSKYL